VVGKGEGFVAEILRAEDQLVGAGGAIEQGPAGVQVELGTVAGRGGRLSYTVWHLSYTDGGAMPQKHQRVEPEFIDVPFLTGDAKVSSKGWVVIPKQIRDELGIKPGDVLSFSLQGPPPGMKQDKRLIEIRVVKYPKTIKERVELFSGLIPQQPGEPSWTENLLRERREEVTREEREIRELKRKRRRSA
jgi:AbrB family looped-hinge helix DNA binding protein